jgi:HAD superfamily hydrolase (TIGR01509 family)
MPLHLNAWESALKNFNLVFDYDFFYSRRGMPEEQIMNEYNKQFGKDIESWKIVSVKHEFFRSHLESVKPIRKVVDVVFKYKNKLPMAIVSGGTRENVLKSLQVIGIDKYFKVVITADDNLKSKPAPDKFFEAAKILGVQPEFCQVFEDGDLGIEAAQKAGMYTVDVLPFIES